MDKKKILLGIFAILAVTGIYAAMVPVHAATASWPLLLDANSTGGTDANPNPSFTAVKTFNIGAVIEANSTTPLNGVFGWQVGIIYDNTTVVPMGDPTAT